MVFAKNMTLLKRVVFWVLAISSVMFMVLAYIGFEIRDTIRHNGLARVHNILMHRLQTIDTYIQQRYAALEGLKHLIRFASRHHSIFDESFWRKSPELMEADLAYFAAQNGFYDLFVVSLNGDVIHAVKKEKDLHTNLLVGKYRDTELARVVANALANGGSYISDFTHYAPSGDYAAFVAEPVFSDGEMIGVIAAQIDNKTLQSVIDDASELGKTGEVIAAVVREGKLLTMAPVRNTSIEAFERLDYEQMTPILEAAGGGSGLQYMHDRSGHNAAVAWAYQDDLRWGIAISINENELLSEWYQRITSLALLFMTGIAVVVGMIVVAFRSFAQPIEELTQYALMMSRGNYKVRIDSDQYDSEWQVLTRVFQQMSADIKGKMDQLNEQNRLLEMHKGEIEELNRKLETKIKIKSQKMKEYINVIDQYVIASQTDHNGIITYASDAFCRISGYTKEELIGKNHRIIRHPDMPAAFFNDLWQTIIAGRTWHGEIKNLKFDGGYYWVDTTISPDIFEGKIIGYTAVRYDITDKKRIEELAITDSMTGLYNRRHYVKIIDDEMNRAKRHGTTLALMMVDVDYFKRYNDTYGHQAGDVILQQVSDVLKSYTSRSGDYAFRLGGEEFGIVISDMSVEEYRTLGRLICRAVETLGLPHEHNDASPYVTISMGIVIYYPESGMSCEELYKEADTQLYRAKKQGRNRVAIK